MALPSKTHKQFVDDMVASWAASLGFQPTLQDGDSLYAMMQSVAGQLVYLQALVTVINAVARAQTSTGADLDTFYAQFRFTRLPGQKAIGPVILGKLSAATSQVLAPVGSIVQTQGGAIQYLLIADTAQGSYDATLNAYVMQPGQTSIGATAQAALSGAAYNVTAGQLAQLGTPVAGIDTVTNAIPISNGADAESDDAFRVRFVQFLNSLSKATKAAIETAISGVQQGIEQNLQENIDLAGNPRLGEFIATIDDGTGSPPQALLDAVFAAVDAVRGFTIMPEVVAVDTVDAVIILQYRLAPGAIEQTVTAAVVAAVVLAINGLGIGETLFISTIEAAALAVPGVVAVRPNTTTINGLPLDLAITGFQAARSTINDVSAAPY